MKISASIVTYQTDFNVLERAVLSFLSSSDSKLYIIDNSPTNDLERVSALSPRIDYRHHGKNLGYGQGQNLILKDQNNLEEYHIVMNPDVFFDADLLDGLTKFMDDNPGVGMLMPEILDPSGKNQYLVKQLPSPMLLILRRFAPKIIRRGFHRRLRSYILEDVDKGVVLEIPHVSGCFMLLRSEILTQAGIFDKRFFMYCEDLDLTRRFLNFSKVVYFPFGKVYHEFGRGSFNNPKLLGHHILSAIRYFNKYGWINDIERDEINSQIKPYPHGSEVDNQYKPDLVKPHHIDG